MELGIVPLLIIAAVGAMLCGGFVFACVKLAKARDGDRLAKKQRELGVWATPADYNGMALYVGYDASGFDGGYDGGGF